MLGGGVLSCNRREIEALLARVQELEWAALPKKPDGSVQRNEYDYEARVGICSEPISRRELNVFTVTHKVTFENALQCNDDDDDVIADEYSIYYM